MGVRKIRCPSCGASEYSGPNEANICVCSFCGTRFKIVASEAIEVESSTSTTEPSNLLIPLLSLVVGLLLIGMVGALFWVQPVPIEPGLEVEINLPEELSKIDAFEDLNTEQNVLSVDVTPVAKPDGRLEIHHQRASGNDYYVFGELFNTSEVYLDKPKIVLSLKDEAGEEVGVVSGYAALDSIPPGGSSPVSILVYNAEPHASYEVDPLSFSVPYSTQKPLQGFRAEVIEMRAEAGSSDRWKISGKVHNEGRVGAQFVKVFAIGRDADQKIVGFDSAYVDAEVLSPGKDARFSLTAYFSEEPKTIEYLIDGRYTQEVFAQPLQAKIDIHHRKNTGNQGYYLYGELTNTSKKAIDNPKILVVLKNKDGAEVGTDLGYSDFDVIQPGQTVPVQILVNDPVPHASYDIEISKIAEASSVVNDVKGLEVEYAQPKRENNSWSIAGKISNTGSQKSRFTKVVVACRDSDGKIVSVESSYGKRDILVPGGTDRYTIPYMSVAATPSKCEFYVRGRVAD